MRRIRSALLLLSLLSLPLPLLSPQGTFARVNVVGKWRILDIVDEERGKVWPGGGLKIEIRPDFAVVDDRMGKSGWIFGAFLAPLEVCSH